jgi:hypothetical protein
MSFDFYNPSLPVACVDAPVNPHGSLHKRSQGRIIRRQKIVTTPGYTTSEDFGTNGDNTVHSRIPHYSTPNDFQANGSFPTNGSTPATVDLIFLDFIANDVIDALTSAGSSYTEDRVEYYLPKTFTTNGYLPVYAQQAPDWQADVPNCPVGLGVGYNDKAST